MPRLIVCLICSAVYMLCTTSFILMFDGVKQSKVAHIEVELCTSPCDSDSLQFSKGNYMSAGKVSHRFMEDNLSANLPCEGF